MIINTGYPVKVHELITEDGYILNIHRIPSQNLNKRPVLVMHGILSSAADFVVCGPTRALGILYKTVCVQCENRKIHNLKNNAQFFFY